MSTVKYLSVNLLSKSEKSNFLHRRRQHYPLALFSWLMMLLFCVISFCSVAIVFIASAGWELYVLVAINNDAGESDLNEQKEEEKRKIMITSLYSILLFILFNARLLTQEKTFYSIVFFVHLNSHVTSHSSLYYLFRLSCRSSCFIIVYISFISVNFFEKFEKRLSTLLELGRKTYLTASVFVFVTKHHNAECII